MTNNSRVIDPGYFYSLPKFLTGLTITFLINCFIALFLYILDYGDSLSQSMMFSQVIGLSICSSVHLALFFRKPSRYPMLYLTVGIGLISGLLIAIFVLKVVFSTPIESILFGELIFLGLSFGAVISLFFIIQKKLTDTTNKLQEEQVKTLENEKNILQARLKLLQAQIEPHFLFNTLANIEGLLADDVDTAREMLRNLTFYLRGSLEKGRKTETSLKEELEMVRAYLDIYKIRMGDRLHFSLQAEPELDNFSVPPMLLQPLVENSILHGLEPKPAGGEISVRASQLGKQIRLEVADTGLGLGNTEKQGIGLSNVKERLTLFFGDEANMKMEENHPSGLRIIMEIPCKR
ncbi:MAG TPA: hypothetical protein EYG88_13890 [Desulfocapsa sulfexigens]|nr:hypothetical protein [Desulfocapsa sulfexigens]